MQTMSVIHDSYQDRVLQLSTDYTSWHILGYIMLPTLGVRMRYLWAWGRKDKRTM